MTFPLLFRRYDKVSFLYCKEYGSSEYLVRTWRKIDLFGEKIFNTFISFLHIQVALQDHNYCPEWGRYPSHVVSTSATKDLKCPKENCTFATSQNSCLQSHIKSKFWKSFGHCMRWILKFLFLSFRPQRLRTVWSIILWSQFKTKLCKPYEKTFAETTTHLPIL